MKYSIFDEITTPSPMISPVKHIQVVNVTGLNEQMIVLLTQYLESIPLPTGFNGDLVFELQITRAC